MGSMWQDFARNRIIVAIAGIILGAVFLFFQSRALDFLVWIMGIIALVTAAGYALTCAFGSTRNPGLIGAAIFSALVGILFISVPMAIVDFLPFLIGIILLVSGITNLMRSFAAAGLFGGIALGPAILSAIIAILGLLVIVRPGALADAVVLFMGVSLIVSGIFDIYLIIVDRRKQPVDIYVR